MYPLQTAVVVRLVIIAMDDDGEVFRTSTPIKSLQLSAVQLLRHWGWY